LKEELRTVLGFLREANQIARELSSLSGELPAVQNKKPAKGYVLKTKGSPLIQKFLTARRARVSLSLQIEPFLGDPFTLTADVKLSRGGNDTGRENNGFGG